MEKNVWILDRDKKELIDAQRTINANGGLRAFCMLSSEAVRNAIEREDGNAIPANSPSLILLDYDTEKDADFHTLQLLQEQPAYAGVPVFFMVNERTMELDELCYEKGATIVLHKPFSRAALLRIERTAWQYDMTCNYEMLLQNQAGEVVAAREIQRLNEQLEIRNEILHKIFGRYFPDSVVNVILEHPQGAAIGGVKEEAVVMMADLRGFTSISAGLSPESVTRMLNYFLGKMTEIIGRHHGTIIEFIGDAILAVFGAPIHSTQPELDAMAAAVYMQNAMEEVNDYNEDCGLPKIQMGVGMFKGEVFIGNIGSEKMMRYNVIGQAVNLASRIESFSVGGQILISDSLLRGFDLDQIKLGGGFCVCAKGAETKLTVYELMGVKSFRDCMIHKSEAEAMEEIEKGTIVKLSPIEGKQISDENITAELLNLSPKFANIKVASGHGLSQYMNVEIDCNDKGGNGLFHHVYAKVIALEKDTVTLNFTYVNSELKEYYKSLLGRGE